MDKRLRWQEYNGQESIFFAETLDIKPILESLDYVKSRQSSTPQQPVFVRDSRAITVRLGTKKPIWIWCDLGSKKGGVLLHFIMKEYNCDTKAAYDIIREIANSDYKTEYAIFKQNFNLFYDSGKPFPKPSITIRTEEPKRKEFHFEAYKKEHEEDQYNSFPYEKATVFDVFLSRGISQQTIDHSLFANRFGNAQGAFGYYPQRKFIPKAEPDFEFEHHLLAPIWDWKGRVVGLGALNKYVQRAYEEKVKQEIDDGGNPERVRINASLYYPGSHKKRGAWISHIPEHPKFLHFSEQPMDAMSYFQLHQDDPNLAHTIFVCTGGAPVEGFYALVFHLIQQYNIENVILSFDKDLAGLGYALEVMKMLPFNDRPNRKCDVNFRATARQEMEIDVVLLNGLSKQTPESLMLSVERLKHELATNYGFEGGVQIYPALTMREAYVTFSIPFTDKNYHEIIRISQYLLKTREDVFQVKIPAQSKDWNDALRGIHHQPKSPSILLIDQPEARNRLYITQQNKLIFHQRFTSFDHNIQEEVGEVDPFAKTHFIKPAATIIPYPFVMDAIVRAQKDYAELIPPLKEDFVKDAVRLGISYMALSHEFFLGDQVIARWTAEQGVKYNENWQGDVFQRKALHWMGEQIRSGKDPNQPELTINYDSVIYNGKNIGTISKWFTFQEASNLNLSEMNPGGVEQLELLLHGLNGVRSKWNLFREKYPEPLVYYSSNFLIFEENRTELYSYNTETAALELKCKPETLINRNFHPFFFKARQLFIENQGAFYNYIRLMRVDTVSGAVFYNSPDHEVGRLLVEGDQKYLALYPNIPKTMRRELLLLSPYAEASEALIKSQGVVLEPTGLNAIIKEKEVKKIPYAYQLFYDKSGKKFSPWSEEKLKRSPENIQQLHAQAALAHGREGTRMETVSSEKERFFEHQGVVYFNRIAVARYDAEKDVLDVFTPPSRKFYQHLATFERNLVQDPTHRVYAEYLIVSEAESKPLPEMNYEQAARIMDKIEQEPGTNRLKIIDRSFKVRDIGYLDDKQMVLNEEYKNYSEVFRETMIYFSRTNGITLEWKNMQQINAVKATVSSIEIPEKNQRYEHQLITTKAGVFTSITNSPVFQKELSIHNGELEYLFLREKENQLRLPHGSAWHKIATTHFWMTQPVKHVTTTLVLAQDPGQAVAYYHDQLPATLYQKEMYLSAINLDEKKMQTLVESILSSRELKELIIIGEQSFVNTYQKAFARRSGLKVFGVPLLMLDKAVTRFMTKLSSCEADPLLQKVMEGIRGHNFLNPAEGLVYFPMQSEGTKSKAILGAELQLSKDVDALWYSRPISHVQRVVLTVNPEEALYYMALNKDFIHDDAIISFQNTVTKQQVKTLSQQLSLSHFHGNVTIANTGQLSEQLLTYDFPISMRPANVIEKTTYREEFEKIASGPQHVQQDFDASKKRYTEDLTKPPGKREAPALDEPLQAQGLNEQRM